MAIYQRMTFIKSRPYWQRLVRLCSGVAVDETLVVVPSPLVVGSEPGRATRIK